MKQTHTQGELRAVAFISHRTRRVSTTSTASNESISLWSRNNNSERTSRRSTRIHMSFAEDKSPYQNAPNIHFSPFTPNYIPSPPLQYAHQHHHVDQHHHHHSQHQHSPHSPTFVRSPDFQPSHPYHSPPPVEHQHYDQMPVSSPHALVQTSHDHFSYAHPPSYFSSPQHQPNNINHTNNHNNTNTNPSYQPHHPHHPHQPYQPHQHQQQHQQHQQHQQQHQQQQQQQYQHQNDHNPGLQPHHSQQPQRQMSQRQPYHPNHVNYWPSPPHPTLSQYPQHYSYYTPQPPSYHHQQNHQQHQPSPSPFQPNRLFTTPDRENPPLAPKRSNSQLGHMKKHSSQIHTVNVPNESLKRSLSAQLHSSQTQHPQTQINLQQQNLRHDHRAIYSRDNAIPTFIHPPATTAVGGPPFDRNMNQAQGTKNPKRNSAENPSRPLTTHANGFKNRSKYSAFPIEDVSPHRDSSHYSVDHSQSTNQYSASPSQASVPSPLSAKVKERTQKRHPVKPEKIFRTPTIHQRRSLDQISASPTVTRTSMTAMSAVHNHTSRPQVSKSPAAAIGDSSDSTTNSTRTSYENEGGVNKYLDNEPMLVTDDFESELCESDLAPGTRPSDRDLAQLHDMFPRSHQMHELHDASAKELHIIRLQEHDRRMTEPSGFKRNGSVASTYELARQRRRASATQQPFQKHKSTLSPTNVQSPSPCVRCKSPVAQMNDIKQQQPQSSNQMQRKSSTFSLFSKKRWVGSNYPASLDRKKKGQQNNGSNDDQLCSKCRSEPVSKRKSYRTTAKAAARRAPNLSPEHSSVNTMKR